MKKRSWGEWAFLVGVVLAILTGVVSGLVTSIVSAETVALVLVVLGILVGLLNVQEKETANFLIAAIALMLTGLTGSVGIGRLPLLGKYLEPVVINIAIFVAPAALVVSLKSVIDLAKK